MFDVMDTFGPDWAEDGPIAPRKMMRVTMERVMDAIERDDGTGFCLACGEEAYGVEPDAAKYKCESCGKSKVYGAEEIMLRFGPA